MEKLKTQHLASLLALYQITVAFTATFDAAHAASAALQETGEPPDEAEPEVRAKIINELRQLAQRCPGAKEAFLLAFVETN